MSPYMKAYKSGIKLAEHDWRIKLAEGREDTVPEDFSERVNDFRDMIEDSRIGKPYAESSETTFGKENPFSDAIDRIDVHYQNIPFLQPYSRRQGPYADPGKIVWDEDGSGLDSTESRLNIPQGYFPSTGLMRDAQDIRRMADSLGYVNPIVAGHEASHAYGADEIGADTYAAMTDYDMFDLADFYNRLTEGGEPRDAIPGDDHLSDRERLDLLHSAIGLPSDFQAGEGRGAANDAPSDAAQSEAQALAQPESRSPRRTLDSITNPKPVQIGGASFGGPQPNMTANRPLTTAEQVLRTPPPAELMGPPVEGRGSSYMDYIRDFDNDYLGGMGSRVYDYLFSEGRVPYANAPSAPPPEEFALPNYGGKFPGMVEAGGRVPYANAPSAPPPKEFALPNYRGKFPGMVEAGRGAPQVAAKDPLNFDVVRGGYAKQFRALQDRFRDAGREDALKDFKYQDMARAMGNRGLRPGDRFDANALLQRMQAMRPGGKGVSGDTPFAVQRQRGGGTYKDVAGFQTLQQQRAVAQQQAPANVNPFGGLRGAGPQRQPTFKPTSPSTPKPKMPTGPIGPHNIDQF
jgi:hypothetical protein